jgi:hypothetical protein
LNTLFIQKKKKKKKYTNFLKIFNYSYPSLVKTSNAYIKFPYSKCEAFGTQYQCLCPKNSFRVRETQSLSEMLLGEYYEDIDECAEGKYRGDQKLCINIIGSYECSCREGYKKIAQVIV